MRVVRIIPDVPVRDVAAAGEFYGEFLGLAREDLGLDWVVRYVASSGAVVQVVTRDASASEGPVLSVAVDDVDEAYRQARERGYEIVHPLTDEPWGVRRFFVRTPAGQVVNILRHRESSTSQVGPVSIEQWWWLLPPAARDWMTEHNGEHLPAWVVGEIVSAADGRLDPTWWAGDHDETATQLTNAACDWIEEAANGEHGTATPVTDQ